MDKFHILPKNQKFHRSADICNPLKKATNRDGFVIASPVSKFSPKHLSLLRQGT